MRRHKHPEDRAHFDAVMAEMLTNHAPFSSRHHIVDTSGRVRPVAVIAHSITDATGVPIGTEGFYLDLTDAELAAVQRDDQVRAFRDSSGVIEQAKGMLMLVYGVNADRAFDVLRWRSQQENVKIRDVAAALVVEIQAGLSVEDHQRWRPRRDRAASPAVGGGLTGALQPHRASLASAQSRTVRRLGVGFRRLGVVWR